MHAGQISKIFKNFEVFTTYRNTIHLVKQYIQYNRLFA